MGEREREREIGRKTVRTGIGYEITKLPGYITQVDYRFVRGRIFRFQRG